MNKKKLIRRLALSVSVLMITGCGTSFRLSEKDPITGSYSSEPAYKGSFNTRTGHVSIEIEGVWYEGIFSLVPSNQPHNLHPNWKDEKGVLSSLDWRPEKGIPAGEKSTLECYIQIRNDNFGTGDCKASFGKLYHVDIGHTVLL